MTRRELKEKAKNQISGNIFILFLCGLVMTIIQAIPSWVMNAGMAPAIARLGYDLSRPAYAIDTQTIMFNFFASISPATYSLAGLLNLAVWIISPSIILSLTMIYLGLSKGEPANIGKLFTNIKSASNVGKAFFLQLLITIFTILWSLLFVIPGIIKSIAYSMSFYVLAENPEMTAREALKESQKIMKGHKWEAFVLALSFVWWYLLCIITFGIASIYVVPYTLATTTNFYNSIKSSDKSTSEAEA